MLLEFKPILNNTHLVSVNTLKTILELKNKEEVLAAEIDPEYYEGFNLCNKYGIDSSIAINCLIVEARRNDNKTYAALLVPIGYKYNMSTVVRKRLNARIVSVAPLDYVLEQTKMEFGSITPIGIPNDWFILIDPLVLKQKDIIIGGGIKKSKLMIPSSILLELPNSSILEGIAKEMEK